jgi:hypothetical protein
VQVQVRHVAAEIAELGDPEEGVQVGAVDVDLPAVVVDDVADLSHRGLEHAVGRRVGDHQRRQVLAVLLGLPPQVDDVDVALVIGVDHDHP